MDISERIRWLLGLREAASPLPWSAGEETTAVLDDNLEEIADVYYVADQRFVVAAVNSILPLLEQNDTLAAKVKEYEERVKGRVVLSLTSEQANILLNATILAGHVTQGDVKRAYRELEEIVGMAKGG